MNFLLVRIKLKDSTKAVLRKNVYFIKNFTVVQLMKTVFKLEDISSSFRETNKIFKGKHYSLIRSGFIYKHSQERFFEKFFYTLLEQKVKKPIFNYYLNFLIKKGYLKFLRIVNLSIKLQFIKRYKI